MSKKMHRLKRVINILFLGYSMMGMGASFVYLFLDRNDSFILLYGTSFATSILRNLLFGRLYTEDEIEEVKLKLKELQNTIKPQ